MKTNVLQASFRALLLTALGISVASVTGCSERLKEDALPPPIVPLTEKKAELPAPPPDIAKCFQTINPVGASMDEKVLNLKKRADAQTACGRKLITWYDGVRAVQNGSLPPPTSSTSGAPTAPPKAQATVNPADATATPKL